MYKLVLAGIRYKQELRIINLGDLVCLGAKKYYLERSSREGSI